MNIKKRFSDFRDALYYVRQRAYYSTAITDESVEKVMEMVDLYRYLYSLTMNSQPNDPPPGYDFRSILADLHAALKDKIDYGLRLSKMYYASTEWEWTPEESQRFDVIVRLLMDNTLQSVRTLYNRMRLVKKISLDIRMSVPDFPRSTMEDMVRLFRNYPSDFSNTDVNVNIITKDDNFLKEMQKILRTL